MASSFPSQSISYRHGVQGCPGGCCSYQQEQFGGIRAGSFPISAYRLSPWEPTLSKPSSSSNKRKAGINMPDTGFNTRCKRHHGSSNSFLHLSAGSNHMLPPTKSFVEQDYPERNGNDAFICMPLHAGMESFPSSLFNPPAPLTPNEPLNPEIRGFLGLNDFENWHQSYSMPVNDALLLNHAVTWPVPLCTGDSHADQLHTLDQGIPDVPPWVNEPAMTFSTSMQDAFPNTTADMNFPLYELYSPFQTGEPWDECMQQDLEDIPLSSFPNNQLLDYTFYSPSSLVAPKAESLPTVSNMNTSSSLLEPTRPLELRNLKPKPPFSPSNAGSGIDSDEPTEESSSKLGRRRCLTEDEKRETALVRQIGSCARCSAKKLKCTLGDVCDPCQKLSSQTASICARGRLNRYTDAFFPTLLFSHLDEPDMRSFMRKAEFTDVEMRVQLSLGPSYPSIPLTVSAFRTADDNFSYVPDLRTNTNDDMQSFATVATSDLGVRPSGTDQLAQACVDYVEILNSCQETRIGSSRITRKVFDAARRFQQASPFPNQDLLLRRTMQIAEIYFLLSKRFVFSKEPSLEPSETSRFLNRQIKSALYNELKKLIPQALKCLDDRLRNPQKQPWAVSLLAHLLLCTCVELIQVAVDAFIFSKIHSEGSDYVYIRQNGREVCRSLEQWTLEHSWTFLEGILGGITKKCNPFKAGIQMNDESGWTEAEKTLVNDIKQIVDDHREEIAKRAEDNCFTGLSYLTKDHRKFRQRNGARIVSKVLRRFC